jgi:hypothetical protein
LYESVPLLPSGASTDTALVGKFVAVVICAALVVPVASASAPPGSPLLRRASQLSGLKVRRPVRVVVESGTRFEADVIRALDRDYPRGLQQVDDSLYMGLGLLRAQHSIRSTLVTSEALSSAYYDERTRVLRVRRRPAPARSELLHELVRALIDQNFGLHRIWGLRARDRDAALAANMVIDGVASLASGTRPSAAQSSPLAHFLALEQADGVASGRRLIAQLRYLGGNAAVRSALRTFPPTTSDVLHVDKFLQHESAQPVTLPATIGDLRLVQSETFGELDVLALLRAFDFSNADSVAAGWAGGRLALYATGDGGTSVALVLRWDTPADAEEWRAAAPTYVAAAFPDAQARLCPAVDHCWLTGERELASAVNGNLTVLTSGAQGELVAAALAG